MKETAIQKINKMGKVGSIIITIAKIFCIIGFVFILAGTIAVGCIPQDFITFSAGGNGTMKIHMDAINSSLTDEDRAQFNDENFLKGYLETDDGNFRFDQVSAEGDTITFSASGDMENQVSLHDTVYVLAAVAITVAMTLVSLFFAGFLCKAFKECESPFEENVIKKMRNFAYSLIPWVILNGITDSAIRSVQNGRIDIIFSIDAAMIFIVLIVLALVYIFQYGAILQQESDETL